MEAMKLMMVCPTCGGKGNIFWTPGEFRMCKDCYGGGLVDPPQQVLYDLELGLALHEALSNGYIPIHQGQKIYRIYFKIGTSYQSSIELLDWYREQKRGAE